MEIQRFEKRIALSEKKPPLEVTCFSDVCTQKTKSFLLLDIQIWIDFLHADMMKKMTSKEDTCLVTSLLILV